MIFLLIYIFISLQRLPKFLRNKKVFTASKFINFNKNNLNNWMNLTKQQRYNQLNQESITYMNQRKVLLETIRKEYKKISNRNSEKT